MRLDYGPADRQPQTDTLAHNLFPLFDLVKLFENLLFVLIRYAGSGVRNRDQR